MKHSPEAIAIIARLSKAKGGKTPTETEEGEPAGEKDSVDSEAKTAAAEDLFRAIRGREPSESEAKATEEALSTYMEACGY